MQKTVIGSFDTFEDAHRATRALRDAGFASNDISLVGNNSRPRVAVDDAVKVTTADDAAGVATGAAAGGALGGAVGLAASLLGLAIPGIGPILAAGPLAAALAGAGAGAAAGGLLGTLVGLGIPEERVLRYADSVHEGGVVLGVRPHNDEDAAHFEQAWQRDDRRDLLH